MSNSWFSSLLGKLSSVIKIVELLHSHSVRPESPLICMQPLTSAHERRLITTESKKRRKARRSAGSSLGHWDTIDSLMYVSLSAWRGRSDTNFYNATVSSSSDHRLALQARPSFEFPFLLLSTISDDNSHDSPRHRLLDPRIARDYSTLDFLSFSRGGWPIDGGRGDC